MTELVSEGWSRGEGQAGSCVVDCRYVTDFLEHAICDVRKFCRLSFIYVYDPDSGITIVVFNVACRVA